MRIRSHLYVLLFVLLAGASLSLADEGMWTFDNPPTKQLKEKYNFRNPDIPLEKLGRFL